MIVTSSLKPYETFPLLSSILQIKLRYNPYGVLSISFGAEYVYYIINTVGIGLIVLFIITLRNNNFERLVLGIILGGAIGNTLDRIRIGKVIDFIDMGINDLRWPTYNIADAALTIGIILILIHGLLTKDVSGKITNS